VSTILRQLPDELGVAIHIAGNECGLNPQVLKIESCSKYIALLTIACSEFVLGLREDLEEVIGVARELLI